MDEKEVTKMCDTCLYFDGVICDKSGTKVYPENKDVDRCWRYIYEERRKEK